MIDEVGLHLHGVAEELLRDMPREHRLQCLTERVTSISSFPDVAEDIELGVDVNFPFVLCVQSSVYECLVVDHVVKSVRISTRRDEVRPFTHWVGQANSTLPDDREQSLAT